MIEFYFPFLDKINSRETNKISFKTNAKEFSKEFYQKLHNLNLTFHTVTWNKILVSRNKL